MNSGGLQASDAGYGDMAHNGAGDVFGQDHYAQDPSQGHGDQYGHGQYGAGSYGEHEQDHGYPNHENGAPEGEDHMATMNKSANTMMDMLFGNIQKNGQFTTEPQHAHSRFSQDPHHHNTMKHFHKIICKHSFCTSPCFARNRGLEHMYMLTSVAAEGLTDAHIESFVHIGTYILAHLAKRSGMTAGHEPEEEGEQEDEHAQAQ
jgi:hypothetical protein